MFIDIIFITCAALALAWLLNRTVYKNRRVGPFAQVTWGILFFTIAFTFLLFGAAYRNKEIRRITGAEVPFRSSSIPMIPALFSAWYFAKSVRGKSEAIDANKGDPNLIENPDRTQPKRRTEVSLLVFIKQIFKNLLLKALRMLRLLIVVLSGAFSGMAIAGILFSCVFLFIETFFPGIPGGSFNKFDFVKLAVICLITLVISLPVFALARRESDFQ